MLEYRKKQRVLRVKMLDGTIKTVLVRCHGYVVVMVTRLHPPLRIRQSYRIRWLSHYHNVQSLTNSSTDSLCDLGYSLAVVNLRGGGVVLPWQQHNRGNVPAQSWWFRPTSSLVVHVASCDTPTCPNIWRGDILINALLKNNGSTLLRVISDVSSSVIKENSSGLDSPTG